MSELTQVVEPKVTLGGFMEDILDKPVVSGAPLDELLKFAEETTFRMLGPVCSSNDLTLTANEILIMELWTARGPVYHNLEKYIGCEPSGGTVPNIERFLVDSGSRLYVGYRKNVKSNNFTIIHTYTTNADHQLKHISPEMLMSYNVKDDVLTKMLPNINSVVATSLTVVPRQYTTGLEYKYKHRIFKNTRTETTSVPRSDGNALYCIFRHLRGFKISDDLRTMSISLAIDPTWHIKVANPWVDSAGQYGLSDFLYTLRSLEELYKLKVLIPRAMPKADLTMDHVKLFGIGSFFSYQKSPYLNDSLVLEINELYRKLGVYTLIEAAGATSDHAHDHKNRFYVEWKQK